LRKSGSTESKTSTEKPVVKRKGSGKVESCYRDKEPVKEPVKRRKKRLLRKKKESKAEETLQRKRLLLSIKIVGN
jgi:hypothetical protein